MPPAAVEVTALKPHSDSVVCCTFAPDVDLCCSGSNDNSLILWRVTDGWTCRLTGHTGWVTCCNFQPVGALLASGSADETLRLWDLYAVLTGDSSEVAGDECSVELKEYGGAIQACAFSQSGALLASASADSHVRVWSVETRTITSVRTPWRSLRRVWQRRADVGGRSCRYSAVTEGGCSAAPSHRLRRISSSRAAEMARSWCGTPKPHSA